MFRNDSPVTIIWGMDQDCEPVTEPGTAARQRTRRAILEAAVAVWSRDFAAPLGVIADRAEVSRSTLHRYFADRQSLLTASFGDAMSRLERTYEDAVAHCSTAAEELEAGLRASVRLGEVVTFLFSDPSRFADQPAGATLEEDPQSLELIRRGQDEGVLAADLDPEWVLGVYYSLVWLAADSIATGAMGPHAAEELAVRTFRSGCAAS